MADLLTPARLHAVEANVALRSSPFSYLISSPRVLDPIDSAVADALAKGLAIIHLRYQRAFQEVLANVTERAAELKISIEGNFFKIVRRALLDVLTGMEPPILPILKEAFEAHPALQGEGVWAGYLDGVSASFPVTIDVVARMNPAIHKRVAAIPY